MPTIILFRKDRKIMNNSEKLKKHKKAKIIGRGIQSKELLLDRGFISTLIETEDIHLNRRK